MVGMSSLCSSFISAGVQPTIQADMRDRTAFSGTLTAVWIVTTVMVLSFGVTSYILIGSDAKSNVVHNLEPGRLLLAIQILMLTHVLTSFVLYINPLYQELEEKLSIPEGSWRQYSFRALCMGLLVLVSEALPDFGHVLDIISVLAITITLVLPPLLYLRLAGLPRVDLKLRALEKAFLVFLVVTGLVCALVAGFGTTSFVFVEQQQGSCFQPRHLSASNITGTTTPASRAIIFKQILTFKPATIA
ncbi:uncharacterized protein LOC119108693 [Pollicipes pollicipes]|uniref:uncharacterized protein LOC119108693 n=1 Tax=Pollicipes pollicipes TaxID=41117 RepID=UPI0018851032|nr:uncharacterized protein LOC119108693 [Pollicipes pollicipes]